MQSLNTNTTKAKSAMSFLGNKFQGNPGFSFKDVDDAIKALQNYKPPKDWSTFVIIGYLLGMSSAYIYKRLTTETTRVQLWTKMRKEWIDKISNIGRTGITRRAWNLIKYGYSAAGDKLGFKKTVTDVWTYYQTLSDLVKHTEKMYNCLAKKGALESGTITDAVEHYMESNPDDQNLKEFKAIPLFGRKYDKNGQFLKVYAIYRIMEIDFAIADREMKARFFGCVYDADHKHLVNQVKEIRVLAKKIGDRTGFNKAQILLQLFDKSEDEQSKDKFDSFDRFVIPQKVEKPQNVEMPQYPGDLI